MLVVMLLGTPGVGKSTVGRALASKLGIRLVELTELAGGDEEVDPRALSARSGALLRRLGGGVVCSHVVFKPRSLEVRRAVVLRRDPLELVGVLRSRGYEERKVRESVEVELIGLVYWEAVRRFGERTVAQLDVTGRSVDEVVDLALQVVKGEYSGERVDWLSSMEESRLEELLRYLSSSA
ncbi:MAG: AAA family ATPase [Aigarchaeota archaeon]|nr:AAA family ATPase [Aigarchaeota archaeon]